MARLVRRTWGWYLVLLDYKCFKVKVLRFSKCKTLSMQYHNYRNELWLFLTGVNKGNWRLIKSGEVHTYNPSRITYILEIQYGDKCEESDIVRF